MRHGETARGTTCIDNEESDAVLGRFKRLQGFDTGTEFPGTPVRQAYLIWAQMSTGSRHLIMTANGFTLPDTPLLPGDVYVQYEDADGGIGGDEILRNP